MNFQQGSDVAQGAALCWPPEPWTTLNKSIRISVAEEMLTAGFNHIQCEPQIRDRVLRLSTSTQSSSLPTHLHRHQSNTQLRNIHQLSPPRCQSTLDHDEFRRNYSGYSPRPGFHNCILEQA